MKKIILSGFILLAMNIHAQVGINTENPSGTLDVVGKPTDPTIIDGVIAPRLTGTQLKAKDALYLSTQTGAIVYVTQALTPANTSAKTINVTSAGYFYFNGTVWMKFDPGMKGPWYKKSPSTELADANGQNIYTNGSVSIGGVSNVGKLTVLNSTGTTNTVDFSMIANRSAGNPATLNFISNLASGSFSSLSRAGDKGLIFSTDGDGAAYSRNGLLIAPHTSSGGSSPFGFKITEQGLSTINAPVPTETFDVNGTFRVRQLPLNGQENAIFTLPNGNSSLPENGAISEITQTQTFTGSRTVISNQHGVLGYVTGLPVTKTASGQVVIENLPVYKDNADASSLPTGTIYRTSTGVLMVKY
ncbi:hypothetical protein [Empedobacter falsenii]|uniref:hypothetical protein n=1 Tax=Empedobacter falsenii TaxID=343874 RepID=UPI001C562827|nr:hypothetical protein [Empedobacter falsenii]MBW1619823.1 hypothetical protein [Empedobacter falsenii]